MEKRELFKIEGGKITRLRRHCPKCGEGVFLGEHKDRFSCGTCGYTEFKSGSKKIPEKTEKEEKKAVKKPKEGIVEKPKVEEPPKGEDEQSPTEEPVKTEKEKQEEKFAE